MNYGSSQGVEERSALKTDNKFVGFFFFMRLWIEIQFSLKK